MKKAVILIFLFSAIALRLHAQPVPPASYRSSFHQIAALKFEETAAYFESVEGDVLDKAYRYHLHDYMDFLKVFISEDEAVFDEALERRSDYIDFWEELPASFPARDFFIGDTYLRWALLRMKFNQKVRAAWELNKAYRYLTDNVLNYPDYYPAVADLGAVEVLIGTVPEQYNWIMNLLDFKGTIDGGKARIQEVLDVAQKSPQWGFLEKPTLFMLSFIDMNMSSEVDRKLISRLEEMDEQGEIVSQPLMMFFYADLLQKQYRNDEALRVLSYYEAENEQFPFYFLYYMKGLAQLYKLDAQCLESFGVFTDHFEGMHYLKSAYQKKAWYHLLQGDTLKYWREMSQAGTVGNSLIGADELADKEADRSKVPNRLLLKSRLLFDGGYFEKAYTALTTSQFSPENTRELTEFDYRMGRVLHLQEAYESAIQYYKKTYAEGKHLEAYYAANAMLMTGRIFIRIGNFTEAKRAFEACLDMSGFDYQFSIHQKARAGLSKIEHQKK